MPAAVYWVSASDTDGDEGGGPGVGTDFSENQRRWLRAKWSLHASEATALAASRDWTDGERTKILKIFGVRDTSASPGTRDFTDAQRAEINRKLGLPDSNTLTTTAGRDFTNKQRDHLLLLYGAPRA